MDSATVADGKLDECIELPGKQIKMSGLLSKVRIDPFMTRLRLRLGIPGTRNLALSQMVVDPRLIVHK